MAWQTPLQSELARTGGILTGAFQERGQRALAQEELGLKRGLMEHQLGRQKEMDALQRPGLQAQAEEANIKLQQLNEPVTVGSIASGDDLALGHLTALPKGETKSLIEKMADLFESKVDVDENSPTYGRFVRKDGTVLKNKDLIAKARPVQALMLANTDPLQTVEDQMARYHRKLSGLQEGTPEHAETLGNLQQAMQWMNDPAIQIKTLEEQRQALSRLPASPEFDKAIERIDGQIAGIRKEYGDSLRDERKHERALELQEQKDRAAMERTKLGADTRLKVAETTASRGGQPTALQRNVPFISEVMGISEKDAAEKLLSYKAKSDEVIFSDALKIIMARKTPFGEKPSLEDSIEEARSVVEAVRQFRESGQEEASDDPFDWRQFDPGEIEEDPPMGKGGRWPMPPRP